MTENNEIIIRYERTRSVFSDMSIVFRTMIVHSYYMLRFSILGHNKYQDNYTRKMLMRRNFLHLVIFIIIFKLVISK